jgi:hypothetical protein
MTTTMTVLTQPTMDKDSIMIRTSLMAFPLSGHAPRVGDNDL